MIKSFVAGSMLAAAVASVASAGFTGYSVQRTVTAAGNIQYQIFANWDTANLVFLNAFNFATQSGSMGARHQDTFTADGETGTWQAGPAVSAADRADDSWVTASGSASSSGWGSALDPGFANGGQIQNINNGAGWYDATPGTPNPISAGGTQGGYRILLAQIVRSGGVEDSLATFYLRHAYKVAGTTTALFSDGTFTIGIPAPGALALLGVAGLAGRRRR